MTFIREVFSQLGVEAAWCQEQQLSRRVWFEARQGLHLMYSPSLLQLRLLIFVVLVTAEAVILGSRVTSAATGAAYKSNCITADLSNVWLYSCTCECSIGMMSQPEGS